MGFSRSRIQLGGRAATYGMRTCVAKRLTAADGHFRTLTADAPEVRIRPNWDAERLL
jgi:hypothetical protein